MKPNQEDLKIDLKREFYMLIDKLNNVRSDEDYSIDQRAIAIAITNLETAQMWAVRSLFSESEVRNH